MAGAAEIEGRDRSRPERVAYRHALADREQVSRALDAARDRAAGLGRRGRSAERRALLDRAATVLARRRGDLIGAMIIDGAKTCAGGRSRSVRGDRLRPLLPAVARGPPAISPAAGWSRSGVVVVAPPWNFPLSIPASGVLAALAAGNSVLLKPAPEAVLVGWHLAQRAVGRRHPARGAPVRAVPRRRRGPRAHHRPARGRGHPHRVGRRRRGAFSPGART